MQRRMNAASIERLDMLNLQHRNYLVKMDESLKEEPKACDENVGVHPVSYNSCEKGVTVPPYRS